MGIELSHLFGSKGVLLDSKKLKTLGVFTLVLLNFSVVVGLRGLPILANYGVSSVFFYAFAAICFLVPVSLVCAELATGWPKDGGVYGWAKQAFGEKIGFLTVWLQWAPNLLWYPVALSFFAATFSFIFLNPSLSNNPLFLSAIIISVYWGATYINLKGFDLVSKFTSLLTIIGIIVPALLVMFFAFDWIRLGQTPETSLDLSKIIPQFAGLSSIAFAIGVFSSFSGMEVHAIRALNLKNPAKDYPKAVFISALLAFLFFVFGTLSIAILVPQSQLNLMTGLMEAASVFLSMFNKIGLIPIIALMICLGIVGQVVSWISGPSKGLLLAAKNGNLPKFFSYQNENGVQSNILMFQGLIVTLIALSFLLIESTERFYWFLTDLYTHLYLIMYLLLFTAAIKLRYSQPNVKRAFKIPFGNLGMWLVAGIGFIATLAGFLVGFVPPNSVPTDKIFSFEFSSIFGVALIAVLPLIIYHFRNVWSHSNAS